MKSSKPNTTLHTEHPTDSNEKEVTIQLLEETLSLIQYGNKKIFMVGTSHCSIQCAQKVRELILEVEPDTIILEMCAERAAYLINDIKKWKMHVRNGGKVTKYHRKQLVSGGEFRTALDEGQRIGARIIYGDIDQEILAEKFKYGLKIALQNPDLTWNEKLKLRIGCIAWKEWFGLQWNREKWISKLKTRKHMNETLEYMSAKAPVLQNNIMDERNDIMSLAMRDCEGDLIVAVVGMDHMIGIEERFKNKFKGIDLDKHKINMQNMHADESISRMKSLFGVDKWIEDDEWKEFKYYRDLPQKTSKMF